MSANTTSSPPSAVNPDRLRIDFVGMAFALAVGEIGLEIGKLYNDGIRLRDHWYLFTHIVLSVYIIASSWIGWQLSPSLGNRDKLKDAFSIPFIILLIDLLLVICYFIVVQSIGKSPKVPSAKNQIFWSEIIFCIYILWDFFAKCFKENPQTNKSMFIRSWADWKEYLKRCYQAPLCLAIIYIIIGPLETDVRASAVVCADLMLILIYVLFRGLKGFENSADKAGHYVLLPICLFVLTYAYYKFIA